MNALEEMLTEEKAMLLNALGKEADPETLEWLEDAYGDDLATQTYILRTMLSD